MSILSSLMDGLAPYIDAGVRGAGAVQRGNSMGEELRKKDALAGEEREERRRQHMMEKALQELQLETGRERLTQMRTPQQPKITIGGRDFPDTPEGVEAAIEWDRQVNPQKYRGPQGDRPWSAETDPGVRREQFFKEHGLGVYRPDEPEAPEPYAREILSIDSALEMVEKDDRANDWTAEDRLLAARRLMEGRPLVDAPAPRTDRGFALPPTSARPPRKRAGAPGADVAAPEGARGATAAPPSRAAKARSRMNLGVHGAHVTEAQRRWDELAADARASGLDPVEAIGYPRP